ncbi:MAG: hypothetical protein ACFFCX_09275, partial [Candidatus Sifarchaeia archaeon]
MPNLPLRYFCYVCGHSNDLKLDVPIAPSIERNQIKCGNCGDVTHLLLTACPKCEKAFRYFLSDLDFPAEIVALSDAYVKLIEGIRKSIKNHIKEFKVPIPKRWSVNLNCECGEEYTAEIQLP